MNNKPCLSASASDVPSKKRSRDYDDDSVDDGKGKEDIFLDDGEENSGDELENSGDEHVGPLFDADDIDSETVNEILSTANSIAQREGISRLESLLILSLIASSLQSSSTTPSP
ncbi:MAG: hypothetical protein QXT73_07685 [Candidatus Methanomethylicaceae archaeon]